MQNIAAIGLQEGFKFSLFVLTGWRAFCVPFLEEFNLEKKGIVMIFCWSLTDILSLLWRLSFHSRIWHRNQSSRVAARLHYQLLQNRLNLASEEEGNFTVVCNLTGDSRMLQSYLSSSGTPFLSLFLYYTLAANVKSHNRKNINRYYNLTLISFYFFPSRFWLNQFDKDKRATHLCFFPPSH